MSDSLGKSVLKVLLGLVFIVSAVLKLIDMDSFEIYIYSYHFFSLNASFIVARLAIILELVLGIGLVSHTLHKLYWWGSMAMLVGYWKMSVNPQDFEYPVDIEGVYLVITEDLKVYLVLKFAESVTFEEYVEYAGKYVAESYPGDVIVNSEDPTTGELFGWFFNNLDQNSFDVHLEDETSITIYRVEPFEYIMPSDGLMKK